MQQVSLTQILSGLGRYFHSVDVRSVVAVEKSGLLRPILTGIRISARSVEEIKSRYAELAGRVGPRTSKRLKVFWMTSSFRRWGRIRADLLKGRIAVERKRIELGESIDLKRFGNSTVMRQQYELQSNWVEWPSVFFSGGRSSGYDKIAPLYHDPEVTSGLIKDTRCRSVEEFVDGFLEVVSASRYDRDFFLQVEMPARIALIDIGGGVVKVEAEGEKDIRDLKVSVHIRGADAGRAVQSSEAALERIAGREGLATFRAETSVPTGIGRHYVTVVLKHGSGLEIDEEHENPARQDEAERERGPWRFFGVGTHEAGEALEEVSDRAAQALGEPESEIAVSARVRSAFEKLDLHPRIMAACMDLYRNGHYRNAVLDASLALAALVRERSGCNLDGASLMRTVFSRHNPILAFNGLKDQSEQDEQEGMMHLYEGAVLALRNPRAHMLFDESPERALEYIAMLSTLAKRADETKLVKSP